VLPGIECSSSSGAGECNLKEVRLKPNPSGLVRLTIGANPKDFQDMRFDEETILGTDSVFEFFDEALVKMIALIAFFANQVMMVFARSHHFVALFTVPEVNGLYEAQGNKGLERSVHGCQSGSLVTVCSQSSINILSTSQILCLL